MAVRSHPRTAFLETLALTPAISAERREGRRLSLRESEAFVKGKPTVGGGERDVRMVQQTRECSSLSLGERVRVRASQKLCSPLQFHFPFSHHGRSLAPADCVFGNARPHPGHLGRASGRSSAVSEGIGGVRERKANSRRRRERREDGPANAPTLSPLLGGEGKGEGESKTLFSFAIPFSILASWPFARTRGLRFWKRSPSPR